MPAIRALVFDVGGTLIHPAVPVGETYARLAQRHGVTLDANAASQAFRQAFKSVPRAPGSVPRDGDDRVWWKDIVRRSLPETAFAQEGKFSEFFEEAYLYYAQPQAWQLFPEVEEVISILSRSHRKLALLSNWDGRLHAVLDGTCLGPIFRDRFISAEMGMEKPDPAIYAAVALSLGIPPAEILSVGDELENDVDAPIRAGWQALAVHRPDRDLRAIMEKLKEDKAH